ncbi:hypothetical protein ABMY35_01135 [Pseudoalteromonas sp. BZB3]|uniref:hypothetical protein n=1 Tax=Pseudoalteromonas sp. BZB3 TaxID=3136670 RepID=UPI0032C43936
MKLNILITLGSAVAAFVIVKFAKRKGNVQVMEQKSPTVGHKSDTNEVELSASSNGFETDTQRAKQEKAST